MTREQQIEQAKEILRNEDCVFVECVNALDSWNGFADGFRCYDMCELDDLYGDMRLSEFLDLLTSDFSNADNFFYHSIYGLKSADDIADVYRDNTTVDEVFDELLDKWGRIDLYGVDDFADLMEDIYNYEGTDDEEPEEELPWAMTNRNGADFSQWIDEE